MQHLKKFPEHQWFRFEPKLEVLKKNGSLWFSPQKLHNFLSNFVHFLDSHWICAQTNSFKGRFFSKGFMKICNFPIFHPFFPLNFWQSSWLAGFEFKFLLSANHKLRQKFRGKNGWKIGKLHIFINPFKKKLPLPRAQHHTVRNIFGIANGKQFSLLPASKKLG